MLDGAARVVEREQDLAITAAYITAQLSRAKRMPKLEKLLGKRGKELAAAASQPQPWRDTLKSMTRWVASLG